MKRLIQLNLGLVKYLIKELPKQKSLKAIIKLLRSALVIYIKENIKMYKNLFLIFDVDYQKQQKEFAKYQNLKVDLQRCLKMLQYVDDKMKKSGFPNWKRRQFWRDFTRDGQIRKEVFDDLLKEIQGLK